VVWKGATAKKAGELLYTNHLGEVDLKKLGTLPPVREQLLLLGETSLADVGEKRNLQVLGGGSNIALRERRQKRGSGAPWLRQGGVQAMTIWQTKGVAPLDLVW